MIELVATVLTASLVGSLHCVGMCGPFAAVAVAGSREPRRRWPLQLGYHGGRLITYGLLGIAAGALGSALNLGGSYLGIQRAALTLTGIGLVLFGLLALARLLGLPLAAWTPRGAVSWVQRLHRPVMKLPPVTRALGIGMLSTLLPCGWLYAFAVTAAGTGSPLGGAVVMASFWAGTLPVMVSLGAGLQRLSGPLRRHVPALTAVLLVVVGLLAIAGRFDVPALRLGDQSTAAAATCHTSPDGP